MPVAIISGQAGEVWTNTTGKILFQLHVDFVRSCALCIQFAGRIGPYWPVPYHDHCLLPGNRVIAPGLKSALATRYDGRALRLRFRGGSTVSVTPNHMLATPIGFMKASSIVAGDDVVCGLFGEAEMLRHPYHDRHPSLIEDVVDSLAVSGRVISRSVPATAEDLHGDGAFCQGNIDVVTTDGFLFDDFDPACLKHPDEFQFRRSYPDRPVSLATPGGLAGMLFALRDATDGGMGRLREFKASLLGHLRESVGLSFGSTADRHFPPHEDLSDPRPGDSEVIRQRKLGFSGDVAVDDLGMHDRWSPVSELLGFRVGSELDPTVGEAARHYLGCDTQRLRDARNRLAGQVSTLKVVAVESMHYVGPVYDLETESTLYTLDGGIVSSNCHCRNIPIKPGQQAMPFIDYQDELRQLGPAAQRNAMGASNWRLVESGLAKWEDVVTKGRVRDFREVADRLDLSVDRMVKAGVRPDLARKAYDATHTEAHAATAKDRAALIKGLKAHGVKDERIAAEIGDLLASRVGVVGPGGAKSGIAPPPAPKPPRPKPAPKPRPTPKIEPAPPKDAAMDAAKAPETPKPVPTPVDPPHVADWRRRVAEAIPKAEAEAVRSEAARRAAEAELEAAGRDRKKAYANFADARELAAVDRRHAEAQEAARRATSAADLASSRASRLGSWEADRKVIPNLVPPLPMAERLALYADGDRKVKAIAALGAEDAAAVEATRAARAKLYDTWAEADRYVRSREFLKLPKREMAKFEETKAKAAEMEAELRRTADTASARAARVRAKLASVLKVDDPMDLGLEADPALSPGAREAADEARKFVSGIVARGDHARVKVEVRAIPTGQEQRDRYDNAGSIHSSHATTADVTVHEAGHAIDDLATTGGRKAGLSTMEFLAHRVGDEKPRWMSDVHPGGNYRFDEFGRKDRFDEVFDEPAAYYTGKVYPGGHSSEVLSMGLQQLYNDPVRFAEKDPEYLKFVLGMLDGSLR